METPFRLSLMLFAGVIAFSVHPSSPTTTTCDPTPTGPFEDSDQDGLPDDWERSGHGPMRPEDVAVGRKDMFLIAIPKPGVTWEAADPQLELVRQFYARVPLLNPDGSTGIHLTIVHGPMGATSMPCEWRGIGHAYELGNGTGGGGQSQPYPSDWSSGGYDWRTVAHELGHQLSLWHTPRGRSRSPVYTSIMNYDYNYSFDGNPNAVHFSTGYFLGLTLNETHLDEILPYSMADLHFLTRSPYNFSISRISDTSTSVDWNRNGVFGERDVSADVNDGADVRPEEPRVVLGATAGSPTMATVGDRLYIVYPILNTRPASWLSATLPATGAKLMLQTYDGSRFSLPTVLSPRLTVRDPNATSFGPRLAVSYVLGPSPSARRPAVLLFSPTRWAGLGASGEAIDSTQNVDQAALVSVRLPAIPITPIDPMHRRVSPPGQQPATASLPARDALWMLTWSAATGAVRAVEILDTGTSATRTPRPAFASRGSYPLLRNGHPFRSNHEIGAAIDPVTHRLVIISETNTPWRADRFLATTFSLVTGRWTWESERWVGSDFYGNTAPVLLLDGHNFMNGHSAMTIYVRSPRQRPDDLDVVFRLSELADPTQAGGWRQRMMIDGWNITLSAPAATAYHGSHVFALRWSYLAPATPNNIWLYKQVGVINEDLVDQDDIPLIATGLHEDLELLRSSYATSP